MRLKYIKIKSDYLIFKKGEVFNFNLNKNSIDNSLEQKFNVIAGSNGSGKTLLMSLFSNFFHNIDRFHKRTNYNIEISYEIKYHKSIKKIILYSKEGFYFISVDGEFNNTKILPNEPQKQYKFKPKDGSLIDDDNQTLFIHIRSYLPKSIVLSTFSIHDEYPKNRPINYIGEKFVRVYDISNLYGTNHYGLPSISRGISRFLELMHNEENSEFYETLKSLGFKYNNKILVDTNWRSVSKLNFKKLINFSETGKAYLNDIEFIRNKKSINFSNMSTGEKMLIFRILSILSEIEDDSFVIIEEPEMHLDFSWNRQLISLFDSAFKSYNAHFLFITHNPYLINSLKKEQVLFLKNGTQQQIQANTFQLGIDELFIEMFDEKFTINISEQNVLEEINETNSLDDVQKIYNSLGNSIYKYYAFQKIKKLKEDVEGK